VAFVFLPSPHKVDSLTPVENVWVGVDYGEVAGGSGTMIMMSGTRVGLAQFAASCQWGTDVLAPELCNSAYHTPLRLHARASVDAFLDGEPLTEPRVPVLSCLPGLGVCRSAASLSASLSRSEVERLSVPTLVTAANDSPVTDIVCIGPYLRSMGLPFTMKVGFLDSESLYVSATVGS
jgi:[acyl-carrier-protein] S-malonyltransferase